MNRNILITGVSKGLGLICSKLLLERGFRVYGLSRTQSTALTQLMVQYPEQLHWAAVDLGQLSDLNAKVFQQFLPSTVPIHGFVNNAAHAYDDLVTNLQLSKLEKLFELNVYAPMLLTKLVIRNMLLHQITGSIVHLSSVSAHTGYKGLAMYAATKGALEAFSKNTAREWGVKNIRSNCVVAGFMETEMSAQLTSEQKARIYKRTSLKKATNMQSVAETIAFLLSEGANSISGQAIFVDGGTI